jgi:esterase/lipase superfamily enzyme
MSDVRFLRPWAALTIVILLAGCAGVRSLMPTPNLYTESGREPFLNLAEPLKTTEVRLFYVTDRVPEKDETGNLQYGHGRSGSLAFGTTIVDLGVDVTWEQLLEASRHENRTRPFELKLHSTKELIRVPPTPVPFTVVDGEVVEDAQVVAKRKEAVEFFRRALAERLALTPRKEVFLFVHGYHNTFDDAAFALAELWHFLGREGMPILYTWPAGYPGLFGYTYDRESSEFTVYHLKNVLRVISEYPEVEKIHIIAHSRGTDVMVSALRELTIWARAAGIDPQRRLKIHNLILAAPDLDVQVVEQRIMAEKIALSVGRLTVYTSPVDKAIGIAETLFSSPRGRIGTLGLGDLTDDNVKYLKSNPANSSIVNFRGGASDSYGHSYFRTNPSVSSDLLLMLRYDLEPGTPGRPLVPLGLNFWRIPPGYPAESRSAETTGKPPTPFN